MNKEVITRGEFYPPNHEKRKYYESDDGYLKYISEKEVGSFEAKKENYLSYFDYMQKRKGSAGYWSNQEKLLPIDKKAMIWSAIVSFDKDFSSENNLWNEETVRKHINKTIGQFLKNNKLNPKNIQYVASWHSNTEHSHVHLRINEIKPDYINRKNGKIEFRKRGKLKESSFESWRSDIHASIINDGISWEKAATLRSIARAETKSAIEMNYLENVRIVERVKNIIEVGRKTNRTSFNSLTTKAKQDIKMCFREFVSQNPEVNKSFRVLNEWYEEKMVGISSKLDNKFARYKKEAEISVINLFIKQVLQSKNNKSVNRYVLSPITRKQINNNRIIYKQVNGSKTKEDNKRFIKKMKFDVLNSIEELASNIEKELDRLGREFEYEQANSERN